MTKTRKFSFIIFGLLLAIAGLLFTGCGEKDYSETLLIGLYEEEQISFIEIEAGQETYIDFTIVNPASGMSSQLEEPDLSRHNVVTIEEYSQQNYTTRYKITGETGGRTTLTMVTKDGGVFSQKIEIVVKQYASALTATKEKLFVTKEQPFTPNENYFEFGQNVTEKSLTYYFYGQKNDSSLLEKDDIKFNGRYANQFASISLVETESGKYLLFVDESGNKYSLSSTPVVDPSTENEHYKFVKIVNESVYSSCKKVETGDKFCFVAVYNGDESGNIFCEREFTIFEDIVINEDVFYSYKKMDVVDGEDKEIEAVESYVYSKLEKSLTLVPDYTTKSELESSYEDYKVAYVKITAKTNRLLKIDSYAEDDNLLSGRKYKSVENPNGTTDYYIEVSNNSRNNEDTFYNVKFYYEGYETNSSDAVNYEVKVPVSITLVPRELLVNEQETSIVNTFVLYNHYENEEDGWQSVRFSISPSDASVEKLSIDLRKTPDVMYKYKGVTYSYLSASKLDISDFEEPLYIKGGEGAEIGNNKNIEIALCFNLFGRNEEQNYFIKYSIEKGATKIEANEVYGESLKYYIDIKQNNEIDASNLFVADAKFSKIEFKHLSGKDVARFVAGDDVCLDNGTNFSLKFSIIDTNTVGEGLYLIKIDNGCSIEFTINAIETLSNLAVLEVTNSNIKEKVVSIEGNEATYYVLNDLDSTIDCVDYEIIANGDTNSRSNYNFTTKIIEGESLISLIPNQQERTFCVYLIGDNGSSDIEIEANGYEINNFKCNSCKIVYKIHFVSFSYIDKLNITKTEQCGKDVNGQEATNCQIYYNTHNDKLRTVSFSSSISNNDAFLFYSKNEEGTLEWLETKFDNNYICWEYKGSIHYIDEGSFETDYGYFDMNTLVYVAKYNGVYDLSDYTETIIARVMQQGKDFPYTINIHFDKYIEVNKITLSSPLTEIRLSTLNSEGESIIAFANNGGGANNPTLVGYFTNNKVSVEGMLCDMFEVSSALNQSQDYKYVFKIKLTEFFKENATKIEGENLKAKFYIVAEDWRVDGDLDINYSSEAVCIDVIFENGTETNRYTLTSAEQFTKFDCTAHYRIATVIDISSIANILPLGEFTGSILGVNGYAEITGINLVDENIKSDESGSFCGLFKSIEEDAYIENVTFSGELNITASSIEDINIGLVAGENKGKLRNIAVKLDKSIIKNVKSGNIGGVVGKNDGLILQDYSFTSLTNKGIDSPYKSYKTLVHASEFEVNAVAECQINFGGAVGFNSGTIQKIDGDNTNFIGYTNYFAYVVLKANGTESASDFFVGGVTGNNDTGKVYGSVHKSTESGVTSSPYNSFSGDSGGFQAGKGLVAGGEISDRCGATIGGIAGKTTTISQDIFTGLTSRVYLRGNGAVAGIVNITSGNDNATAFSLQAVANNEIGINASMIIVETESSVSDMTYERIAFGFNTSIANIFTNVTENKQFTTFLGRTMADKSGSCEDESYYFGDFIIVKVNGSSTEVIYAKQFEKGDIDTSVDPNIGSETINNKMGDNVFYAYYFQIGEVIDGVAIKDLQNALDEKYNQLTSKHALYPIKLNGEFTLTSESLDILTIDADGTIIIKKIGLAKIVATSILNGSKEDLYIYVINYFNSTEDISIIYPTQSNESTPLNESTIKIIAKNQASVFVLPDFKYDDNSLKLDKNGVGKFSNVYFSLKQTDEVKVSVEVEDDYKDIIKYDIVGNQILFSGGNGIEEKEYNIKISQNINVTIGETNYTANVNKKLENIKIAYKKGAIKITTKYFEKATIHSSTLVKDVIKISSTANEEEGIEFAIYDKNNKKLDNDLFSVTISQISVDTINGVNELCYSLEIAIDTNSVAFNNRGQTDIYQTYTFAFYCKTNTEISCTLPIAFEKTEISGISITNYKDESLISSSEQIVPGTRGYFAISLSPVDGDFDYITIENATDNYKTGNSWATFGISYVNASGSFENSTIVGSATNYGMKFTREQIESLYENFDGTLYVNYIFATQDVENESISTIIVKAYKNGSEYAIADASKRLTVKLPYFVKISIEDKTIDADGMYAVARGLEYKLNIESYGYDKKLIEIASSDSDLGNVEERNGEYYLKITENKVFYGGDANKFYITLTTTDDDMAKYTDRIRIRVQEYVVANVGENEDIVSGMGDGVINVQIGSKLNLEIDLFDYIEYNTADVDIKQDVEKFLKDIRDNGVWSAKTNLNETGTSIKGGVTCEGGKEYLLEGNIENYYFKYSNYSIIPVKTHEPIEKGYKITYSGYFKYENGKYKTIAKTEEPTISTEFWLNVYTSSSDQSPIPIFEYRDLLKMHDGGYYILLNNITVPSKEKIVEETEEIIPAFSPITTKFASLDGNGLSITFAGCYDVGSATSIAPFVSLSEGCVIKNLTVCYTSAGTAESFNANGFDSASNLAYFKTSASTFTFGGIVAQNQGAITNCKVKTTDSSYITIHAPNSTAGVDEDCYIGMVAGENSGYITNSTVSVKVQAPFNIGGIVGKNNGKISGCSFKEGIITNVGSKTGAVAGITVINGDNAQILTSFVSGDRTQKIGTDKNSIISSPYSASGFVYQNQGSISDCYTAINLEGVQVDGSIGFKIAGFVGINGGSIRNSYSVSTLPNNRDSSSGFAESDKTDNSYGSFSNCYYLSDPNEKINVDLKQIKFEGVEQLTLKQFDPGNGEFFKEYAQKSGGDNQSVWFYPNGNTYGDFVDYSISGASEESTDEILKGKQVFDGEVISSKIEFASGRLELVNANTMAISRRVFDSAVVDSETNDIIYNYVDDNGENCPARGSLHNPILIYSVETMEEEILSQTSKLGLNTSVYRMICDIDYSDYVGLSNLYTVTFAGMLEGNGMVISNISLESSESLTSAGLFAGVGYSKNKQGSIKNLNVEIERMNFSQTTNVGGIAGVLKYGELHGITVKSSVSDGATIVGANFVGGIVGKAIISYEITDVYSEMNVLSSFISEYTRVYEQTTTDEGYYSYGGSIAGFLGTGTLYNARCSNIDSIVAGKAGFAYGGLGKGADVHYTFVDVKLTATIKSNMYAGFIAGEIAGTLDYAYVSDNDIDSYYFDVASRIPYAVGGITGRLAGGTIINAVVNQTLNVNNFNQSRNSFIQIVGGLVGVVEADTSSLSKILDSLTTADIYARGYAGGAVGSVLSSLLMDSIAVKSSVINISGQTSSPIAGGIIGQNEASTTMTNSYSLADIQIRVNTPGVGATIHAGGLVANASKTNILRLGYCYTTSKIEVEAYDSRALGNIQDFASINASEDIKGSGSISINHEVSKSEVGASSVITNVYYLGGSAYNESKTKSVSATDGEASKSSETVSVTNSYATSKSFISFRGKTKDANISLNVANFGTASNALQETRDNQKDTMQTQGNKDIMKNLFVNRYKLDDSIYYKMPDIGDKNEVGFSDSNNKYVFETNSNSTLVLLGDTTKKTTNVGDFKQIKIYRDDNRNVYTSYDENTFVNIFTNSNITSGTLEEVWNFETWDEFSSLAFEKNLNWINKTTLGR